MKNNRITLFLGIIFIISLACSLSFTADLGDEKGESPNTPPGQRNKEEAANSDNDGTMNNGNNDVDFSATEPVVTGNSSHAGGQFSGADEVINNPTDENLFSSPTGQDYIEVQIKTGPNILSFTEDFNDGCYEIHGLGTATIVINRVGEGRDCKEIGGIGLFYGE